ncbi:hypothetical protein [Tabrizicola sp.]|uniref:hypothetical protein n=1 Tax=Tabrizicola sp. TaxID=2005166 RepID=UPI0027372348|nr:hypothetical protein [Tabrizicola sp.]MDP3195921.1 hypothetical protein [Tabrizicola sp.]
MRSPVLTIAVLIALACPAPAEAPNLTSDQTSETGSAARLILAQRSYEVALSSGDPVILISAISMARKVTLRAPTAWTKTTDGDPAPGAPEGRIAATDPAGPEAIAIARGLAGDDPKLQDLVYDLDAQLPHGRWPTAVNATATLDPDQTDIWTLVLAGEVAAEIGLIGDGDTALGLAISDESGAVVCALPAARAAALCRITPARNGFFTVKVHNPGLVRNTYRLVGN